jgi:hypothetical protein
MYNRQRPHLYYGGQNQKSEFDLLPRSSPSYKRIALTTNSNGTQSALKGKGWRGSLDNLFMSMFKTKTFE